MRKQSFENHVRYYTQHHFVFYPLLLAALSVSVYASFHSTDHSHLWLAVTAVLIFIGWSSFMMRQHYALENQNRIIRMELRFRYYVLTGSRFEPLETELGFRQLAALRFVSDEELPDLVNRAIREKLSPDQIKKLIVHWLPDEMRV